MVRSSLAFLFLNNSSKYLLLNPQMVPSLRGFSKSFEKCLEAAVLPFSAAYFPILALSVADST